MTSRLDGLAIVGVTLAVAWGVAAFGAVYDWGLTVLFALTTVTTIVMIARTRRVNRAGAVLAAILVAAAALQIVPLPAGPVHRLAHRSAFMKPFEPASTWQGAVPAFERISVVPAYTARAVEALAALAASGVALMAFLGARTGAARRIARNVSIIGVLVAVEGLAQKQIFNGKIYWFWESQQRASHNYFGPFVNRNHFAGWMILASALTAGWLASQLTEAMAGMKPGWRYRILWFGSSAAAIVLLTATALLAMFVSLVFTMSRSGIAGASLALTIIALVAAVRMRGARKLAASALIVVALTAGIALKGSDKLVAWYGTTDTLQWRFEVWRDSMPMLRDFWRLGAGLNTYSALSVAYPMTQPEPHADEAHNDYLQLAVEGGLIVSIPALIVAFAVGRTIVRRLRTPQDPELWWIRLGATAGLCGIAVQEITDFSLQIAGVACLFVVLLAIATHAPPASVPRPRYRPTA